MLGFVLGTVFSPFASSFFPLTARAQISSAWTVFMNSQGGKAVLFWHNLHWLLIKFSQVFCQTAKRGGSVWVVMDRNNYATGLFLALPGDGKYCVQTLLDHWYQERKMVKSRMRRPPEIWLLWPEEKDITDVISEWCCTALCLLYERAGMCLTLVLVFPQIMTHLQRGSSRPLIWLYKLMKTWVWRSKSWT